MHFKRFDAKDVIRFGSLLLFSAGLIALLAWLVQWKAFLRLTSNEPFMTCDTALGFMLSAAALFSSSRRSLRLSRALGLALVVFGCLYLVAAIRNSFFSVHYFFQSFTAAVIAPAPLKDFRTAAPTALVFLLLGCFVISLSRTRAARETLRLEAFLVSAIASLGVLGLLVRLIGVSGERSWTGYLTAMAIPTAFCACLTGACAWALFWSRHEKSERRFSSLAGTLTFIGLLLLFAGINSAVFSDIHQAVETKTQTEILSREITAIHGLVESIRKAETSQRGFLLTDSGTYLRSYNLALREIDDHLAVLRGLPYGDWRTRPLRALVAEKLSILAAAMRLEQDRKPDEAVAIVKSGQGQSAMAQIDTESARLLSGINAELAERLSQNQESLALLQNAVVISSTVAAIVILLAVILLRLEIARRAAVESNLEIKVEERTAELRAASDRLRLALDFSKVAVWIWRSAENETLWSGPVEKLFGRSAAELRHPGTLVEAMLPEDRDQLNAAVGKSIDERSQFAVEFRVVLPNGEIRWIAGVGGVLADESGRVTQMAGVNFDISARKHIEQQLEQSERHFRELAECMPQIVWTANAKGEFDYHNDRWRRVTGLPKTGVVAEDRKRVLHPDDFERWSDAWKQSILSGEPYEMEYRLFDTERQQYRWYWGQAAPVRGASGEVVRWFGASTDIHERKIAEIQLAESERALRKREEQVAMLFDSGSIGDFTWDFEREEITAHAAIWSLLGEPNRHRSGPLSWFIARVYPDDAKTIAAELQAARELGRAIDVEFRVLRPDKTVRWLAVRGVASRDQSGKPIQMHGLCIDITERKLAALKIEESKELLEVEVRNRTSAMELLEVKEAELVGSLAEKTTLLQEVHHRVKNNLQVISSLLRMQAEAVNDRAASAALKESHGRVLSMALIHEQLYGNRQMDQIDFAEFTQTLTGELFRSYSGLENRITCRLNLKSVLLQIDQAIPCGLILNELVTNALKYAYPQGAGEVAINLEESETGKVTVSVSDQGVGLPKDFDWTKSKSMGLPIVDLLTQQLEGKLRVRSNRGATFTVEFPKKTPKPKAASAA